ncbi:MAG TPA: ABC transporter ATP-binding protein [Labilithrix sp.]|nr:ABC transporter ATP-binding protein [Labilithrix sp.]
MSALLEAKGLWKTLGGRIVLRGVDLTLAEGERIVVLGANGSGKSTLLQLLACVVDADEGSLTIPDSVTFGFAPEKPDMPDHLLVGEWLDTVAALRRATPAEAPFSVDVLRAKPIKMLSLGQRQRVSLASAWIGAPRFLILDEPTNALDVETRAAVMARISETTAIVATHDREVAERIATRIIRMEAGAVRAVTDTRGGEDRPALGL